MKPMMKDHPKCHQKVVFQNRWSLVRGIFDYIEYCHEVVVSVTTWNYIICFAMKLVSKLSCCASVLMEAHGFTHTTHVVGGNVCVHSTFCNMNTEYPPLHERNHATELKFHTHQQNQEEIYDKIP